MPKKTRQTKASLFQPEEQAQPSGIASFLKRYESEISSLLGIVVALVLAGGLLFFIRRSLPAPQISDTAETQEQAEASPNPNEYTVKQGDGLWQIAQDVYGDGYQWRMIAEANGLTAPYTLSAGQKLTIPEKSVTAQATAPVVTPEQTPMIVSPSPTAVPTVAPSSTPVVAQTETIAPTPTAVSPGTNYTVKKGDHLWKIAVMAYGDGHKWTKIYEANKAKINTPSYIEIGWELTIPAL